MTSSAFRNKVRLVAVPSWRVYVDNTELGVFCEEGRWQGMLALSDGKGSTLVVDMPQRNTELMAKAFGHDVPAVVIKASPALLDLLSRPDADTANADLSGRTRCA